MPYYLSPAVFFLLEGDSPLAWDTQHHRQFLLEPAYWQELCFISKHHQASNAAIAGMLFKNQLIIDTPPETNWGFDDLSRLFHLGTKDVLERPESITPDALMASYLSYGQTLGEQAPALKPATGKRIPLPAPNKHALETIDFWSTLHARKTCRRFFAKPISLETLSTLLFASFGNIHGADWAETNSTGVTAMGTRRAAPASGALHSESVYVCCFHVDDLAPGIYRYLPDEHALSLRQLGDYEADIIHINADQFYAQGLSIGIYLTCDFRRHWWKYHHSKQYKIALLDMGHLSQNFLLTATALGLNTWLTGAFMESEIDTLLDLDPTYEAPALFLGAGIGSGQAVPELSTFGDRPTTC